MRALVASLFVALVGCASTPGASPRRALAVAAQAMAEGDAATLYAMLPEAAQHAEPFARFAARLARQREEQAQRAEALRRELREGRGPVVRFDDDGRREALTQEESDGWHVVDPGFGPPVGAYLPGRAGVRAALRGLREALLHRDRADPFVHLVTSRAQAVQAGETAALAEALSDPMALDIRFQEGQPDPNRVQVALPDGRRLSMVREAGVWRVDALPSAD
ncbi:MAG: hypothetical protein JNK72_25115 [Myxococcales bacterium]|nr:hypothetical protein [Myxococcales bacterium]